MEGLVRDGKVAVNGVIVRDLALRVFSADRVTVKGAAVTPRQRFRYFAYYKPRGVLTTTKDPGRRKTIRDGLPIGMKDLRPVGRLDADTEGLILLTDDGAFANRVAHPSHGVPKVYEVDVLGEVRRADVVAFAGGIALREGGVGRFRTLELTKTPGGARVKLVTGYGRKRMIRQMFAARGFKITRLKRVAVGAVEVGDLKPGEWRALAPQEVASFFA